MYFQWGNQFPSVIWFGLGYALYTQLVQSWIEEEKAYSMAHRFVLFNLRARRKRDTVYSSYLFISLGIL
jgi:hypothetical protein